VVKRKLPVAEIVVVSLALAAGAFVYWWAHRDQAQLEESKERGAVIVEALLRYRAEHETYPTELSELVPEYAPRIEEPSWGLERWRYRRFTPDELAEGAATDRDYFNLSVAANESGYPVLFYDYVGRRWVLNN
jgi:type II secretory pathway pseudopilin PulG